MRLVKSSLSSILLLLLGLLCSSNLAASELPAQQQLNYSAQAPQMVNLQVGVILEMPFAQVINGHYSGIAVDIWEQVALANHWKYHYIALKSNTNQNLLQLSKSGELDVIIGPVSVTYPRMQIVEFTRPFFLSSLGVIAKHHGLSLSEVLQRFFSQNVLYTLFIFALSFIIYILVLWCIERGKLKDVFSHYYSALSKGIGLHLLRKGFAVPKAFYLRLAITPTAVIGRFITLAWLIFAAVIFTSISANYIATMTLSLENSNSKVATIKQLQRAKVAGVRGQNGIDVAEKHGIYLQKTASFAEAMSLLATDKVDAVITDATGAIAYLQLHDSQNFFLSPLVIQTEELAFATRLNSPYRHQIDIGISALQDTGTAVEICQKYIPGYAIRCDI